MCVCVCVTLMIVEFIEQTVQCFISVLFSGWVLIFPAF